MLDLGDPEERKRLKPQLRRATANIRKATARRNSLARAVKPPHEVADADALLRHEPPPWDALDAEQAASRSLVTAWMLVRRTEVEIVRIVAEDMPGLLVTLTQRVVSLRALVQAPPALAPAI